ncbi:MAG: S8 family serine peptidase, partial [Muribaculaceae bacterium]|nr:S8 family serine peptidase [Muribaculaceae bacterium]
MRKLLLFFVVAISATSLALADNIDKLSAGTQMFLSERDGKVMLPKSKQKLSIVDAVDSLVVIDETIKDAKIERLIAEPEMINGTKMISAFVRVKGGGFGTIEGMGAVMQTKFNDCLAAMLLPVDKIEAIADLSDVVNIEVAEVLHPVNDRQRTVTQAIGAITNSDAAKALGITNKYTGKNVILGVIDTGIDFQHLAFKDKNGNNRIVRAYKLSGSNSTSLTTYSSASQISNLTYDTNAEDHGTHTSTTAGGSSVIVNGTTVTVTDDHGNATYGGMAPEADLVIAGLSSLYTTSIGTAIQNICNYADQVGKPCVISLSLGSQAGPHDGTGTIADIVNQYAGNNHIIVYAASNDGMRANAFVDMGTSNGGGMYASGTSTSNKPMMANLQRSWADASGNVQLYASTIHAYARSSNVATALKFHVVDTSTGDVVFSSDSYNGGTTISMTGTSGLGAYFYTTSSYYNNYGDRGSIRIVRSTSNNKYYWTVYTPLLVSRSYSQNSSGIYESKYALCISVYPTTSNTSSIIDMWEGGQVCWFGNDLTLSSSASNNFNLVQGNDECSVSDNACYSKVISVGAFVTRNSVTNYAGTVTDASEEYPNIGDHAYFSSWQSSGYGPLGTALPHINAPGARIIAGINHYHTASVDNYSYWSDNYKGDLIVNNSTSAYGAMEGTSMATPCVSGIIAQWLQACVEAGKTPSPDYIKEVMAATWDTDQWTNGAGHGAKTFGTHGKINAIKGIQYILGCSGGPVLTATPESLSFNETYVGESSTKTITVTGTNLQGNVTATISGANSNMFSVSPQTITKSAATNGATVTVTYTPTAVGTHSANLVLTTTGADAVTIPITGTALAKVASITVDKNTISFENKVNESKTATFNVKGEYLNSNISVDFTQNDNNAFSKNVSSITVAQAQNNNGYNVTVTFNPHALGTHNGKIKLSSDGVDDIYITLTGTVLVPEVIAVDDEVTLQSKVGGTATATFGVLGANLVGPVNATLTDNNGVFSINPTSISIAQAEEGYNVTVSFMPVSEGDYTGKVILTSDFAQSAEVTINGHVVPPVITVDNDAIEIFSGIGRTATAQFTVKGQYLTEDITATLETLEGEEGAFMIDKTSISVAEAESADGCVVTITFMPTDDHEYYGGVTLTSGTAEVWVVFTGKIIEPTLVADESIDFFTKLNGSVTKTFNVMGECLAGPVTLTLNDENGVFSLEQSTISIAEAESQTGYNVPVTFSPTAFVDDYYSATVTLTTPFHTDVTVALKGYVNKPQ